MTEKISTSDRQLVARLLGREPRGLEAIQVRNAAGGPSVIRVSSLVAGQPFPTLFWLVDKQLCYWLDGLEARGTIAQIQAEIDHSTGLQTQLVRDHQQYIAARAHYMTSAVRQQLLDLGYLSALQKRGIGGLGNFGRVRCLHTYYAAHLVEANVVGKMIEALSVSASSVVEGA